MSSKAMSLKGRIKNYAKSNNIAAQVVLQNYMFERFLERLSVSNYNEKFVVKGGMFTTRPRDFYDVFILGTTQEYDKEIFKDALKATALHRGTLEKITDINSIIKQISSSSELIDMWAKYQKKFAYARDITYENVMEKLIDLVYDIKL